MNVLFNLKNKDFPTRISVLDFLKRELETNTYYSGRYNNSMNNGNEYIRFHNGSVEVWILIPMDLFNKLLKQTFKSRNGQTLNIQIGNTIYLQENAETDNPTYSKMTIQSPTYTINSDFIINYDIPKTTVYKARRGNSMSGFIRIKDNIAENGFVFEFIPVKQGAADNQHI